MKTNFAPVAVVVFPTQPNANTFTKHQHILKLILANCPLLSIAAVCLFLCRRTASVLLMLSVCMCVTYMYAYAHVRHKKTDTYMQKLIRKHKNRWIAETCFFYNTVQMLTLYKF